MQRSSVRLSVFTLLLFIAYATTQFYGNELKFPKEVSCKDETITLVLSEERVTIPNTNITVTTRLYNSSLPGPTVRMQAGKTCTIKLINNLSTTSSVADCHSHDDNLNCPDTTNLHTHGLHVSSDGYGDNINVTVLPGETFTYMYPLREQVLMGTHWYHPHNHGSTTLQVLGGAFGMLIVDPAESFVLPSDLKVLYDNAKFLSLNDFDFRSGTELFYLKSWRDIAYGYKENPIDPNITHPVGEELRFYAVNGQKQPHFTQNVGEVFLLRILHASGARVIEIEPDPITSANLGCQMVLLARDGVLHRTPYLTIDRITMLQGTRADVAIKCTKPGILNFSAVPNPENELYFAGFITNERTVQPNIWQVNLVNKQNPSPTSFPTSQVTFPDYLPDLTKLVPARNFSIHLAGFTLLEEGVGFVPPTNATLNDQYWMGWDEEHIVYTETLCLDTLYQINIIGGHPYHQHVNHFQVKKTNGPLNTIRPGEYRDVVLGGGGEGENNEVMYMKTFDYTGIYIVHCHIVEHEDAGLMGCYRVIDSCQETMGDIEVNNSNGKISLGASSAVKSPLLLNMTLDSVFEFQGKDYTKVPTGKLSWTTGLGVYFNSEIENPPYPELCNLASPTSCFDIDVFGDIANSTYVDIGDASLSYKGGWNPTTKNITVNAPINRKVTVPPKGLKFDINVNWTANKSSTTTSLAMKFNLAWTYTGAPTTKYTLTPSFRNGTVVGYTLTYGTSSVNVMFPGDIVAQYPDGTISALIGNIVQDNSTVSMTGTNGKATIYVLFQYIQDATIRVDPVIYGNDGEEVTASFSSGDSSFYSTGTSFFSTHNGGSSGSSGSSSSDANNLLFSFVAFFICAFFLF